MKHHVHRPIIPLDTLPRLRCSRALTAIRRLRNAPTLDGWTLLKRYGRLVEPTLRDIERAGRIRVRRTPDGLMVFTRRVR
jgi:hypothetical protein